MTFEDKILSHCLSLLAWDRDYAAEAIRWYLATCPWLEPLIGAQLRAAWLDTKERSPTTTPGATEMVTTAPAGS